MGEGSGCCPLGLLGKLHTGKVDVLLRHLKSE
jgi:hypothetical protein